MKHYTKATHLISGLETFIIVMYYDYHYYCQYYCHNHYYYSYY